MRRRGFEAALCAGRDGAAFSDEFPIETMECKTQGEDIMIYTELTKKAMNRAYDAHHGQKDKGGVPYIFHPIHVAEQMQSEYSTICALLHDVAEDTEVTLEELAEEYPSEVMDALKLLTHEEDTPYLGYVRALKDNAIAREVKLADLRHNSDTSRASDTSEKALQRMEKYKKAIIILTEDT